MDSSKFVEESVGRLVRITDPYDDSAFMPSDLPPAWTMPSELWPLLVEAHKALGNLNGIGQTLPDPELLLRPLQKREALRSSSLEGTFATPEELLLFELQPREPTSDTDRVNDWREVFNYGVALREGYRYLLDQPPSILMIRQLHKWLMEGARGSKKQPGEVRDCQVCIGSDRRFVPPPPIELQRCLEALEVQLRNRDENYDPLVNVYILHYQFEAIHPFRDGNARPGSSVLG